MVGIAGDNIALLGESLPYPVDRSAHARRAAQIAVDDHPVGRIELADRRAESLEDRDGHHQRNTVARPARFRRGWLPHASAVKARAAQRYRSSHRPVAAPSAQARAISPATAPRYRPPRRRRPRRGAGRRLRRRCRAWQRSSCRSWVAGGATPDRPRGARGSPLQRLQQFKGDAGRQWRRRRPRQATGQKTRRTFAGRYAHGAVQRG